MQTTTSQTSPIKNLHGAISEPLGFSLNTSRSNPASDCSFTVWINYRNERECRQSYAAVYDNTRRCGILFSGDYSTNYLGA